MFEVIFLWSLALVWVVFATVQDIRQREIANWLNYSLIIFAIGFRFFYALFSGEFYFLYYGLMGLGIFFILSNIFYYSRLFAGGDYRLMVAFGVILPIYDSVLANLKLFLYFVLLFLIVGSIYGIIASIVVGLKNREKLKKQFKKQLKKNRIIFYSLLILSILLLCLGFWKIFFLYFGIFLFVYAYLIIYAKSVDDGCMVRKVKSSRLTEGDWLFADVKIGKKIIKKSWEGLGKKDITLIRKHKKEVLIRFGIQFGPVFLISFIIMVVLKFCGILF